MWILGCVLHLMNIYFSVDSHNSHHYAYLDAHVGTYLVGMGLNERGLILVIILLLFSLMLLAIPNDST